MPENDKPQSEWARKRAAGKARRAKLVERRETYFDLMMSGYSVPQIARTMSMSVSAVRRAIARALADRRLDSQEDFARLQVARLNKALLCADALLEQGDVKAIPHFVKVVAELDRYHGVVRPARLAPPAKPRPARLPPPPLALTHAPAAPFDACPPSAPGEVAVLVAAPVDQEGSGTGESRNSQPSPRGA